MFLYTGKRSERYERESFLLNSLFTNDFDDKFVYTYKDQAKYWKSFTHDVFFIQTLDKDKLYHIYQ